MCLHLGSLNLVVLHFFCKTYEYMLTEEQVVAPSEKAYSGLENTFSKCTTWNFVFPVDWDTDVFLHMEEV